MSQFQFQRAEGLEPGVYPLSTDGLNRSQQRDAYLTFSVDDGHPTDLRTAEMLARLGLHATFYVPARNDERPVMRPPEIRELAKSFEIGSHTMNHRRVHHLNDVDANAEIADGKKCLEDILSKEVISFCYPGGKYNARTGVLVANAGFIGARTCQFNLHTAPADPFRWGVSTQAYSHGLLNSVRRNGFAGSINHILVARLAQDWETHFLRSLDWVEGRGGSHISTSTVGKPITSASGANLNGFWLTPPQGSG